MTQTQQRSEFKPIEKQILNSGYVIICDNIQEHKLADEQQQEHIYYTYTETRYTQIEYMQVIEKEKDLLKTQLKTTEERLTMTEQVLNEMLLGGM